MLLSVDLQSSQPLHDQIAGQLRAAIASGQPAPGDKLPSAKELAQNFGVNINTMLRAYKHLHDEGLVEVRRGRGTIVTEQAPSQANVAELARQLVDEARKYGITDKAILDLVGVQL